MGWGSLISAILALMFLPSALKEGGEAVGALKRMWTGKGTKKEAEGKQGQEDKRFLGMLEEKARKTSGPEVSPDVLGLMTLINQAGAPSVNETTLGEEGGSSLDALASALSQYGQGDVNGERIMRAMTQYPSDARLAPLMVLRG